VEVAAPRQRALSTSGIALAAGLTTAVVVARVGPPSVLEGLAILGFLGVCLWAFTSERYALTLGVLALYLGLADGYLKLSTGSSYATLARDALLYAIVAGALARLVLRREQVRLPPLSGWVLAYALIVVVEVFNPGSFPIKHAIFGMRPHLEFVPLFFLGYAVMRDPQRLRVMLVILLICGAANGVVNAIQFNQTPDQLAAWGPGYAKFVHGGAADSVAGRTFTAADGTERVRPFGLGGDAGAGGLIAVLALPGAIALITLAWRRPKYAAAAIALSLGVVTAIATSQGRGVVVAAFVMVFAYALLSITSKRLVPTLAGIAVGGLVVVLVLSAVGHDSGSVTFARYQSITPGNLLTTTQENRGGALSIVSTYASEFPFGHGLATTGPAQSAGGGAKNTFSGESEFAFLVLDVGIAGLLLLVGFTVRLLVLGLTRLRRIADPELRTLLAGIIAPLFGILALYVGGPATTSSPLAPYLWFVAGIMAYWLISRPDLRVAGRA
jgi:hypothetical protein